MSWEDRLREAAYTSPSGTRITFAYVALSRETPLRNKVFQFPNVDGGYVQQNGVGPRRYPMRCFFSGADHDVDAIEFEAACIEPGIGKLEHPTYGTFNVVPVGSITRRDDLVAEANQSVVEVDFMTTLGAIYPSTVADPENEILTALSEFSSAAAGQFESSTILDTAVKRSNLKASLRKFLRSTSSILGTVSSATLAVDQEFRDYQSIINFGIDVFIGQPLVLARQIVDLLNAPARALAGINDRLDAYGDLAADIFGSDIANPADQLGSSTALLTRVDRISNDFHAADLWASGTVSGSVTSALNTTFTRKPEAIASAGTILDQFDALVAWRDDGFAALKAPTKIGAYQVDTGEAYQQLQKAVALTAGQLIEVSFSLTPERRIVLDRPRTAVDLAAELYGSVDDRLDFLISSNKLTGQEIVEEIPRGRKIVYYDA